MNGEGMGRANLEVFAATLAELARTDKKVLVVTSDSRGSGKLAPFAKEFPERMVEVGIAEQSLVGVAAGLASCGKKVFAVSPASFLTARALEQIKNDVCYAGNPVVLAGISAGVSYGPLGSTHHSLHDLAALRAIHNIDILVPADNCEAAAAVRGAYAAGRPAYLRFGKAPLPHLHGPGTAPAAGRALTVRRGTDAAFIACGETVASARDAAEKLKGEAGLECRVLSLYTLKPLDTAAVLEAARECRAVVTVEEHSEYGGMGEACARVILEAGINVPFRCVAIPDEDTVTGSQAEIFRHYGISADGLARTIRDLVPRP